MPAEYLTLAEGRLAFEVDPPGRPLVICVPGMGDLKEEYRYLAPQLREAGFRPCLLDIRGHGQSDVSFQDYTPDATGRDVCALAKHLGGGPAFVVADSFACASAVWAAAEAPQDIRGIVLCGPFVRDIPMNFVLRGAIKLLFMRPWVSWSSGRSPPHSPSARARACAKGPSAWGSFYASLYPTKKPHDFPSYSAALVRNMRQPGRLEACKKTMNGSKSKCEARIDAVKCPVLIVMGTKDPDFSDPAEEANVQGARLKAKVVMVKGAGHYPHAEMPEVAGPEIVKFLGGIPV
jgi:pimeloyl-ACP methyl ester carboxylesterase